ncbi:MAG TPA: HAD-IIIA family hydrolase [Ktedonobacteraceae bacterium]|jgi:D-glycero-D-manno-heptose 1,7-bisphosphate phosphatase
MKSRALFLDRDGTLVHPVHYPSRPEELQLYANLGPALRALQEMGFLLILITNQSGLAKGYFTAADLQDMHAYLRAELLRVDVKLAGIYYCPHHPEGVIPKLAVDCTCRKPQPGLLLQAAAELDIDLAHSWFIGDILDDVEAGKRAGCRTVLVDLGTEGAPEHSLRQPDFVARNTLHALSIVRAIEQFQTSIEVFMNMLEAAQPPIELFYQPLTWQKSLSPNTQKSGGVSYD